MLIKVLAIVQARMSSKRLPGKVLKKINGISLIEILFHRLSKSSQIDKIILVFHIQKQNKIISSKKKNWYLKILLELEVWDLQQLILHMLLLEN